MAVELEFALVCVFYLTYYLVWCILVFCFIVGGFDSCVGVCDSVGDRLLLVF